MKKSISLILILVLTNILYSQPFQNVQIDNTGSPEEPSICINPKILSVEDQVKDVEGCLSFPGLYLPIVRYNKIVVEFYGLNGDKIQRDYSGLLAVAFQHEVDHLDGITFDSKVSKLVLDVNLRKRKKRS